MRWPSLRALVFLRRIARSLDRSAAADEELVRLARSAVDSAFPRRRPSRPFEIGTRPACSRARSVVSDRRRQNPRLGS